MTPIRIKLNEDIIIELSPESFREEGFITNVESRKEVPVQQKDQKVTLVIPNLEINGDPKYKHIDLKVGDHITILGGNMVDSDASS